MYTIAICDDEQSCVEENHQLVAALLNELGMQAQIDCFTTTEQLYAQMKKGCASYHLLLLDIQFQKQSGMELAQLLRQDTWHTDIIFITGYDDYVLEGYDVQAVQYLLKPVNRDKLKKAISRVYEKHYEEHPLLVQLRGEMHSVLLRDITYMESFYRTITLHLNDGETISFSGTMASIQDQLPTGKFASCHKSYCVNLKYVRQIKRYEVLMENGDVVPASKGYYDDFRRALAHY